MKKFLLPLLLGLTTTAYAEVKISYNPEIPQQDKPGLEQRIKAIAGKFMKQPYADLGPCDFLGKYDVNVCVIPFKEQLIKNGAKYFPNENTIIIINVPFPLFERGLIHDFSHAYDWNKDKTICEKKPTKKECFFLEEIKDKMPKPIYNALINVKSKYIKEKEDLDNWDDIYASRWPIILNWYY